jgi:hypothetical protein
VQDNRVVRESLVKRPLRGREAINDQRRVGLAGLLPLEQAERDVGRAVIRGKQRQLRRQDVLRAADVVAGFGVRMPRSFVGKGRRTYAVLMGPRLVRARSIPRMAATLAWLQSSAVSARGWKGAILLELIHTVMNVLGLGSTYQPEFGACRRG